MSVDLLPTKDQAFASLRKVVWVFAASMDRVFGSKNGVDCGWSLLGLQPGGESDAMQRLCHVEPAGIDIHRLAIAPVMGELYEYAINGRWDESNNWIDFVTDTQAFLFGLRGFELMNETSHDWEKALEMCLRIVNIAHARQRLDEGSYLTFADLALLANMDEKSVRNASNPKGKDPLKTVSEGSRTYVNSDDAKVWLSRRRGFKPTVFVSKADEERNWLKTGFASPTDFGGFIRSQREKIGISRQDFVAAMGMLKFGEVELENLENGEGQQDLALLYRIALILGVDPKSFIQSFVDMSIRDLPTNLSQNEL